MSQVSTAVAVIGSGVADSELEALAYDVGRRLGEAGVVLMCGGLGGVMEAAARGAREAGAHTVGILPGLDRSSANRFIEFAVATGMGEGRNLAVVASADAVLALRGEGGTLAEIGFALKLGRPVVALKAWPHIDAIEHAQTPDEAVRKVLEAAARRNSTR